MEILLALVAIAALVVIPVTVEIANRGQRKAYEVTLAHLREAARVGEPKEITEQRLALEGEKIRLQAAIQQEVVERRKTRNLVDVTS